MSSVSRSRRLFEQLFNLTYWVPFLRPGMSVPGDSAGGDFALADTRPGRADSAPLRRSLKYSVIEGTFAEVITAFSQGSVLTAWALYVGANTVFIGLLAAMPFLAQVFHVPSAWITQRFGRKPVAFWSLTVCRQLFWLLVPLAFVPWTFAIKQTVLISVALLQGILTVIGANAWVSWMGDTVPAHLRGRYFGKRNAIATLGGTIAALAAGLTMDAFKGHGSLGYALATLSALAAIAGLVTSWCFHHQHDPKITPADPVSLTAMLRPFLDPHVRPFLTYQALWNFAVALASTFIPVHMVKNLGMNFSWVALHATLLAFFRIVASPLWGKLMDRVGARPILVICSFGISLFPVIWLFPSKDMIWPVFVDACVSGTLWAGHAVAIFSLPFSLAPKRGRPFYLAAFTAVAGGFFAAASITGGAIAQLFPAEFMLFGKPMVNIHGLFMLSFVARLSAARLTLLLREQDSSSVRHTVSQIANGGLGELRNQAARFGLPLTRR